MTKVLNFGNLSLGPVARRNLGVARAVIAFLYVSLCLIKLPATGLRDSAPQSWEAALSYAAAHHLQWGRDIVFTFGPLGFLTADYYWGNFFWPIVLWAFGFALAVTGALVPLLAEVPIFIRLPVYAALPLLTVPSCSALGFDSIHFLSITVLGIACLPGRRPGALRLIATGAVFAVLSLIKFTFCIYSIYTIVLIATSNRIGLWKNTVTLAGSLLLSLLLLHWWTGQSITSVFLYVTRSAQMAAGYSGAMGLSPEGHDSTIGIALLIFVVAFVFTSWLGSPNWRSRSDRIAIAAAGIFLAWKEGFVRADVHVVVFFVYSFFLAALLPALLGLFRDAKQYCDENAEFPSAPAANPLFRRRVIALSTGCMFLSVAPFVLYKNDFRTAVRNGLVARNIDTFNAFLRPTTFKRELELQLDAMRHQIDLPRIRAVVAGEPVDAMNRDQDVAILNGFNYTPHPVFQSYSAFTPELQRLNATFFNSEKAPQYLLWRQGSIDGRFPTLDDGEALLTVLRRYSLVMEEQGLLLWKRQPSQERCSLENKRAFDGSLDEWVPISTEPTWLRIECKPTLFGAAQGLLLRCSEVRLEVQLDNGAIRSYRLLPGNARNGFVISPFLYSNDRLIETARSCADSRSEGATISGAAAPKIVAARVRAANQFAFAHSVHFAMQTIHGLWPLHGQPPATESKEISRTQ